MRRAAIRRPAINSAPRLGRIALYSTIVYIYPPRVRRVIDVNSTAVAIPAHSGPIAFNYTTRNKSRRVPAINPTTTVSIITCNCALNNTWRGAMTINTTTVILSLFCMLTTNAVPYCNSTQDRITTFSIFKRSYASCPGSINNSGIYYILIIRIGTSYSNSFT